jgi:anti-sigma B factor antagonist
MVHIDSSTQQRGTRLFVRGELDMTTVGALDEALIRAARSGGTVEIDLAEVDFIDGSGLSALMDAESRARRANQELRIVAASSNVRRLIDFTDTADRTPRLASEPDDPRTPAASI